MRNVRLVLSVFLSLLISVNVFAAGKKDVPQTQAFPIEQIILKQDVLEGVSADEAIAAIKSKAIEVNLQFVAHQKPSKALRARGVKSGRLEIFQFCNPMDAYRMVQHDPIFAAYMPCRIALVEDKQGKLWLLMMSLDMVIADKKLPEDIRELANTINYKLLDILDAGSTGKF